MLASFGVFMGFWAVRQRLKEGREIAPVLREAFILIDDLLEVSHIHYFSHDISIGPITEPEKALEEVSNDQALGKIRQRPHGDILEMY